MLSAGPRRGSAISLDGGETLSVHREDFEDLRATRPKINEVLTNALVREVRRLSAALIEALYVPVERRVWLRLIDLVELFGGDAPVVIPLTQDDIAQLAGTTRPTANRVLRAAEEKVCSVGSGPHRDPRSGRTTTARSLILSDAAAGTSGSFRIPSPSSSGRRIRWQEGTTGRGRAVQQTRRSRSLALRGPRFDASSTGELATAAERVTSLSLPCNNPGACWCLSTFTLRQASRFGA